jgi:hypothetical protein
MGLFSALVKTAIETAQLPISVAKDAATIGGVLVGQGESYTKKRLRRIGEASSDKDDSEMSDEGEDLIP